MLYVTCKAYELPYKVQYLHFGVPEDVGEVGWVTSSLPLPYEVVFYHIQMDM